MKLAELKSRLKNKYVVKIVSGVLVVTLAAGGLGLSTVWADKGSDSNTEAVETTSLDDDAESQVKDVLDNAVSVEKKDADKDETVYFITNASGTPESTIVVDHLANKDGKDTIQDVSKLSDIENVKGDEEFTQSGDKLTWTANGNDIYYRGTTEEKAPVTQKVTYLLDGKEIQPEELAGKSGKVTIRFNYTNNTSYKGTVDGKEETVCVPFAAITAMVLDDSFSNVEVTNGKVESTDGTNLVIGYALPGLKDSLGIKDGDLSDDVDIPDYFEVTADVEDFSMDMVMTMVSNASDLIQMGDTDTSSVDDMVNQMVDATSQLQDGSSELASGMDTFKTGLEAYLSGADQINAGLNQLGNGVGSLTSGATQLNDGAQSLSNGAGQVDSGAQQLNAGLAELNSKAGDLNAGAKKVDAGVQQLVELVKDNAVKTANASLATIDISKLNQIIGYDKVTLENIDDVIAKVEENKTTLEQVLAAAGTSYDELHGGLLYAKNEVETTLSKTNAQLKELTDGTAALAAGTDQLVAGTGKLAAGSQSLVAGTSQLSSGAQQLAAGTQSLVNQIPTLTSGVNQLVAGSNKLVANNQTLLAGATQLQDGSKQLADGIVQFNEEGISKIVNAYNGDIKPLVDRLQLVLEAGDNYQTFSGLADGQTGSVKFVYKLSEIKADETTADEK